MRENKNRNYLVREDGTVMPIADWNNVKVFLQDQKPAKWYQFFQNQKPAQWYQADEYQTWAFFDFVYSDPGYSEKNYIVQGSTNPDTTKTYTTLPFPPNGAQFNEGIIFRIFRENNDVYYEKYGTSKRIPINDNEYERIAYVASQIEIQVQPKGLEATNTLSTVIPKHPASGDWFECAFGFSELSYANAKQKFNAMFKEGNNTSINGMNIGKFEILNNNSMRVSHRTLLLF